MFGSRSFELANQRNLQDILSEENSSALNPSCDEKAQLINLANKTFGFNGWSYNIVNQTIDYIDSNEAYKVGVSCSVKVTLKDGTFREDCGYGFAEGASKGQVIQNARKIASEEALRETLKGFGSVFQNLNKPCSFSSEFAGNSIQENLNNGSSSSVKNLISPEGCFDGGESKTAVKCLQTSVSSEKSVCHPPVHSIPKKESLNRRFSSPQLMVTLDRIQPNMNLKCPSTKVCQGVIEKIFTNENSNCIISSEPHVNIPDNKESDTPHECQSKVCQDNNSENKCLNGITSSVECESLNSTISPLEQVVDIPDNESGTPLELGSTSSKRGRPPNRSGAKKSRNSSNKSVKKRRNPGVIKKSSSVSENSSVILVGGNTSEQCATAANEVSSKELMEIQKSSSVPAVEMQSQDNCLSEKDSSCGAEVKKESKISSSELPLSVQINSDSEIALNLSSVRIKNSDSASFSNLSNVKKVNLKCNEQMSAPLLGGLKHYNRLKSLCRQSDKSELYLF